MGMHQYKKGFAVLIAIVLVFFVVFLFNLPKTTADQTATTISCYIQGQPQCFEYETAAECTEAEGSIDSNNALCQEGCCCYQETNNKNSGQIVAKQYCSDILKATPLDFLAKTDFETATQLDLTAENCATACSQGIESVIEKQKTQCDDQVDNDNDGLTDFNEIDKTASDPGCSDKQDNSEVDTQVLCTPTANTENCDCAGKQCAAGHYCYDAGNGFGITCHDTAPKQCTTGDKLTVSIDQDGCQQIAECSNGYFTGAKKEPNCPKQQELCTDTTDANGNGKVGCAEPACANLKCSAEPKSAVFDQVCKVNNQYKAKLFTQPDSTKDWICCLNKAYDCNGDTIPDSCEPCSCEIAANPVPATLKQIQHVQGTFALHIPFEYSCKVSYTLLLCTAAPEECAEANKIKNYPQKWKQIETKTNVNEFVYTNIAADSDYCFAIQANYAQPLFSTVQCTKSGNKICLTTPATGTEKHEFCSNSDDGVYKTFRTEIYYCDSQNRLHAKNRETIPTSEEETTCKKQGKNYYCFGPDKNGEASCLYQSTCIFCGIPFNMYTEQYKSKLFSSSEDKFYNQLCKDVPLCYYDYTQTTADAYDECKNINSCADYRSNAACELGTGNYNNKCLTRNCDWQEIAPELGLGICKEENPTFNKCSDCEKAAFNTIFNSCDVEKCKKFSTDTMRCYLSFFEKGTCAEEQKISCVDYQTPQECLGSEQKNAQIDVVYDAKTHERISGTNKITHKTTDFLGIGTCHWDPYNPETFCFKDANGDGSKDAGSLDITPPVTQLGTPQKTQLVKLEFSITDESPKGRPSAGVKNTYYCYTKTGQLCYPTTLYDATSQAPTILPIDQGLYDIFFYSIDAADNLEEVKLQTVDVDRKAPTITIDDKLDPADTEYPYYSSAVLLTVTTDEDAVCSDSFESAENKPQIDKDAGSIFQAKYSELQDGSYRYSVTCTDALGNTGSATKLIKVDADIMIQNTLPFGVTNSTAVVLEVTTLADGECGVGSVNNLQQFAAKQEISIGEIKAYRFSLPVVLSENKEYSYKVSCSINGKIYSDEIQFVLDTTPPKTTIVDITGKPFNTQQFYTGKDLAEKIFFSCKDSPQYGFDCSTTHYCITDKQEGCTPDKVYDPAYSIDETFSQSPEQIICYYSQENTIKQQGSVSEQGGLLEQKQCLQLHQDIFLPEIDVQYLSAYSEENGGAENPYQVYGDEYELVITVEDKDTLANPPINNVIAIQVQSFGTESEQVIYQKQDIPANQQIKEKIQLGKGLNAITITARDRSLATASKTYYVYVAAVQQNMIELTNPLFGISNQSTFDLEIKLKENLEATGCMLSFNKDYTSSMQFDKQTAKIFTKQLKFTEADQGIAKKMYVKCKLPGSAEATTSFILFYDNTKPVIKAITLVPSNNAVPPTLIQPPIRANITVQTDDIARCQITKKKEISYLDMLDFPGYEQGILQTINTIELSDAISNEFSILRIGDKQKYTYYIQCDNGLLTDNHITERVEFNFSVDTSIGSEITIVSPQRYSTQTKQQFVVETQKLVDYCSYGVNADNLATNLTTATQGDKAFKQHKSTELPFKEGSYTYYFACKVQNIAADTPGAVIATSTTFTIDTSPPLVKSIDDGVTSASLDTLAAVFNCEDNQSGIKSYTYSIGTKAGATDVLNWTTTANAKPVAEDLKLKNNTLYYWNIIATNNAGLDSTPTKSSDGVKIDTSTIEKPIDFPPLDHCKNKKLDQDETGIDCGGNKCTACLNTAACKENSDCASGICLAGVCKKASCEDDILNQEESDIDCGGNSCEPCAENKQCNFHSDCTTKYCKANRCTLPSCFDGIQNGDETGVDCGGKCIICETEQSSHETTTDEENEVSQEDEGFSMTTIILLLVLVIILLAGSGYYYYATFMQKKQQPITDIQAVPAQQRFRIPSQQVKRQAAVQAILSPELKKKKELVRKQQREMLLRKFDTAQAKTGKEIDKKTVPTKVAEEQAHARTTEAQQKNQSQATGTKPATSTANPLAALAKTVKVKSANAIEDLKKNLKK